MKRREFLSYTALGAAAYTLSNGANVLGLSTAEAASRSRTPFSEQWLQTHALKLAKRKYQKPSTKLPDNYKKMSYIEYRDIRFNPAKSIWKDTNSPFQLQMFHNGFLYKHDVDVHLIERQSAKQLKYSTSMFTFGKHVKPPKPVSKAGFSGFRIHTAINSKKILDEFCLFQGASYFRAVAAGQAYGLSARGLAINTGQPAGEEFPIFRSFWIETPTRNATSITIYALLDTESVVGIYRFVITPGNKTVMDVKSTLYPRKKMDYVGIGPLTSMFMHGPGSRRRFDDFRPRVHDSEGLCIQNGKDEIIWRPLVNPKSLQFSSFMDENPKGFGLVQRTRKFTDYQDLEADYEQRPSLWVKPQGDWGRGQVHLIEIPTSQEIHDNIVAFWKPEQPLKPGQIYQYDYSLIWGRGPEVNTDKAYIEHTRQGKGFDTDKRQFVLDYKLPTGAPLQLEENMKAEVTANGGVISDIVLQSNDEDGGVRLNFKYDPQNVKYADLRSTIKQNGKTISEVWVYRWET
ncbi:MAG: glucan biosynthesis protein [Methyloligellaceae bacterium]